MNKSILFLIPIIMQTSFLFGQKSTPLFQLLKNKKNFTEIQQIANDFFEKEKTKNKSELNDEDDNEYMAYKRWEYYWQNRLMPDGSFPNLLTKWNEFQKIKNQTTTERKLRTTTWRNISQQVSNSGYNGMGRIITVAFHPTNPSIIYIGAPMGGIWKTTDAGITWIPLGDNLPYCSVGNIVVSHSNPNTLFITVGRNEGWTDFGLGIYKSIDGGNTWLPTSHTSTFTTQNVFYKLIMDPTNANILYSCEEDGLFKTTDGGNTWYQIKAGTFTDLEFKPFNSATFYTTQYDYWGSSEIFKSIDTGNSFTPITTFNQQKNSIELAVTPADSNILAIASVTDTSKKLYVSINSGFTYQFKSTINNNFILYISPTDKNKIYCGYVDVYRSTDGGNTWTMYTKWYNDGIHPTVHADEHFVLHNPLNNLLYFCNDGGIYTHNEVTEAWTDISNGLIITQFYKIALSQQDSVFMIGGTQDNGGRKRIAAPVTWASTNGGDAMEVAINNNLDDIIYTTYVNGKLYRSYDKWNADTYHEITPDTNYGSWVTPYLLDPNNNTHIIAGYHDVWKSTDNGDNWTPLSTNLVSAAISDKLQYLDVCMGFPNTIYTARNNTIYSTLTGGATWLTRPIPSSGGTFESVSGIAIHPFKPSTVYVSKGGYGAGSKIYQSKNQTTNWKNISYNLPNVPTNCIVIDQQSDTSNIEMYVGTDIGIFYKKELDTIWTPYGTGLPNTESTDIEILYKYLKIRVATYGRGIWETDLARTQFPVNIPYTNYAPPIFSLLQNPIHQNIMIEYQHVQSGNYQFILTDLNGKEINSTSLFLEAGHGHQTISVPKLATGMYLMNIITKQQKIMTLKISLL